MKKSLFIIALITMSVAITQAQNVNIPDVNFKNALLSHTPTIDTNGDGEIQVSEATAFTDTINVKEKNISDLTGIEAFTNLTGLNCMFNNLASIDVSENVKLKYLQCGANNLSSLDVSQNTELRSLDCSANFGISSIDVSHNPNLTSLTCAYIGITSLTVTDKPNLTFLGFYENSSLTSLNLSNLPALEHLDCSYCSLTSLDVSTFSNLTDLLCTENQLTSLDVSHNLSLESLLTTDNNLTNLDVSQNVNLEALTCGENQITELDVSNLSNLTMLRCQSNPNLTYINLKNGNNVNIELGTYDSNFQNLPNLNAVCVDALDTALTDYITSQVGHSVNYSTDCSSFSVSDNNILDFSVYPVPVDNFIEIETDRAIAKIEIYNKLGQIVIKTTAENQIDISNLSKGIYFVKVKDVNGYTGVKKIVKN